MIDKIKLTHFAAYFLLVLALFGVVAYYFFFVYKDTFGRQSKASENVKTYYISPNGKDTNNGTKEAPYKTFAIATKVLKPGDTLLLMDGVYTERLALSQLATATTPITVAAENKGGAVIQLGAGSPYQPIRITGSGYVVSGIKVVGSESICVMLIGPDNTARDLEVTGCKSHGIELSGRNGSAVKNTIYRTVLENYPPSENAGWGSGLKVAYGADGILLEGNVVYENYGEGIALTRTKNAQVRNNISRDNYSVNLYVDNSSDVIVENNFVSCSGNTEFYRKGSPATGIAIAEEYYSGWGNQLARVTVLNNIVAFSGRGLSYYGADQGEGGLDTVTIAHNTFWGGTESVVYLAKETLKTRNTKIFNNIFHTNSTSRSWNDNTAGIELANNFWVGNLWAGEPKADMTRLVSATDLTGDLSFEQSPNPTDPNSFRLNSDVKAIDAGAKSSSISSDFFGNNRPVGGGFDIGAHEVTDTVGSPGITIIPTSTPVPVTITIPSSTPTPSPTPLISSKPTSTPYPQVTIITSSLNIVTETIADATYKKSYSQTFVAEDKVNSTLSMRVDWLPKNLRFGNCKTGISSTKSTITCTISGIMEWSQGPYTFSITVRNGKGESARKTYSLKVNK